MCDDCKIAQQVYLVGFRVCPEMNFGVICLTCNTIWKISNINGEKQES
jgi:hypothetical protein